MRQADCQLTCESFPHPIGGCEAGANPHGAVLARLYPHHSGTPSLAQVAPLSGTRRNLPIGSSRARVTTANARWSTACEHYWRLRGIAVEMGMESYIDELEAA